MRKPLVSAIAAIGKNRELGKGNTLLWHIPDDLKRFRALSLGKPIIFGRKTFDSLPRKPLPGRTNIIVTRDPHWRFEGAITAHSVEEAIQEAKRLNPEEIIIGGGAQIYANALPFTDKLFLTLIDAEAKDADAFFPPYEDVFTNKVFEEAREWNGLEYRWIDLEKPSATGYAPV